MLDKIVIKGAKQNNLKDMDLTIPRDKLVVFTGLSGSGKSTLAFDTIFAEGQRRYMESLSSYARQFLGQMEKPDVERIDGLSPAISIDQKTTSNNPRSTVGTVTEIYDYFRLLYARVGIPHCPDCGREIKRQSVDEIVERVLTLKEGSKILINAPVVRGKKGEFEKLFDNYKKAGYVRVEVDGEVRDLSEKISLDKNVKHNVSVVVDRLIIKDGISKRLTDSIENALKLADKVSKLRVFPDENGKTNLSLKDVDGKVLSVSQFTLCADLNGCNRPSFSLAAKREKAIKLYELFNKQLKDNGFEVQTGEFGADMKVSLVNDGPFTILLEN